MGLLFSTKLPERARRSSFISPNQSQKCDNAVVNSMRKDLNENPEMFLLNNILMSIQFYENFEREMDNLRRKQISEKEIELNRELMNCRKHCLLPDTVMNSINKRIRFRPHHGSKKLESEPLLPQRIFVVHDEIEALHEGETYEYSTVDGPLHRAFVERTDKHPGYVQLKQVDGPKTSKRMSENTDGNSGSKKSSVVSFNLTPPTTPGKQRLFLKKGSISPSPIKENQFTFAENEPTKRQSVKNKSPKNRNGSTTSTRSSVSIASTSKGHENIIEYNNNNSKEIDLSTSTTLNAAAAATSTDTDDNDYSYSTLKRLTSAKPLSEIRAHRNVNDIISYCITEIKEKRIINVDNDEYDDDDDDSDSDNSLMENGRRRPPVKKEVKDFFEIKRYFNSEQFYKHFGDVFATIYPLLGLTEESFHSATSEAGRIFVQANDETGTGANRMCYEVIPAIATSWPTVAYEWNLRHRKAINDKRTNIIYKWPTDRMRAKIIALQAYVLPVGYYAKRGLNETNHLEWSLSFPAAERYMECCMSHAQVRCYLFVLALYKTFMEPATDTKKLGLVPHHILTMLFWEIERNFVTWPEDRLGLKMINILKVLYDHLAKGHLADYFVRHRNLLESCPSKYLRISQAKLHAIIERPVMHALIAFRNLRYTSGTFFPTLNFKTLYNYITASDSLALINPALATTIINNNNGGGYDDDDDASSTNEYRENTGSFWKKMQKSEDKERKWKRELRKQMDLEKREREKNREQMRRTSIDSINLESSVLKLDLTKRRLIMEFFIKHFIKVAQKCYEYESYKYALVVLEHAHTLAVLLSEEPSGELEARPLKQTIIEEIDKCQWKIKHEISSSSVRPPPTTRAAAAAASSSATSSSHISKSHSTNSNNNRQIKFDLSNLNKENNSNNNNNKNKNNVTNTTTTTTTTTITPTTKVSFNNEEKPITLQRKNRPDNLTLTVADIHNNNDDNDDDDDDDEEKETKEMITIPVVITPTSIMLENDEELEETTEL